ncbi:GGDEF domain-containing protein [Nocardia tengchongensis]|uniref:GGDEF domain-containing protein n=2 Tax=Nocardia tengchongensis TaxID=2055889 RepID=UPI0036776B53
MTAGGIVRDWWRDPLDYRWLVRTLESRGALPMNRIFIATCGGAVAVISALNLMSAQGPVGMERMVTGFNVVIALLWVGYWMLAPWPGERLSLALLAGTDVLIAAGCVVESNHLFGSACSMLLVLPGGYLTVFHGPRVLAVHAVWCLLAVLTLAWLTVADSNGDVALAVSIVLTTAAVTVVLLPSLHFCYWVLRMDALVDPLTTLLNRRGLDYYVSSWFGPNEPGTICAMVVDLDRFKKVNDTYGHAAGDQVLVRVAARLRAERPPGSLVTRTGGEEFVVFARLDRDAAVDEADRLRRAIEDAEAATSAVTASIGVTVIESHSSERCLDAMLHSSDSAMYRAKQLGGNTVVLAD